MEKQKGKIPPTDFIVLESCKEQWDLFAKGLTKKFSTTGIVCVKEKKLRIKIQVLMIKRPMDLHMETRSFLQARQFDDDSIQGIQRSSEFFDNVLNKNMWILLGYIDGDNQVPVAIIHYENINISIYSQHIEDQNINKFFKDFIWPSAN